MDHFRCTARSGPGLCQRRLVYRKYVRSGAGAHAFTGTIAHLMSGLNTILRGPQCRRRSSIGSARLGPENRAAATSQLGGVGELFAIGKIALRGREEW